MKKTRRRRSSVYRVSLLVLLGTCVGQAIYLNQCHKTIQTLQQEKDLKDQIIKAEDYTIRSWIEAKQNCKDWEEPQLAPTTVLEVQYSTKDDWNCTWGEATSYAPYDNQDGQQAEGLCSVTSVGLEPSKQVFAVDPNRIPYYSEMLVITDNACYRGIAGDTGGALRNAPGVVVDIFSDTYEEALSFGRQDAIILWKEPSKEEK